MSEQTFVSLQILKTLAKNGTNMTFEDLSVLIETLGLSHLKNAGPAHEKLIQSVILENLIALHDQGLVWLNPETDECSITQAGLQKIKSLKLI